MKKLLILEDCTLLQLLYEKSIEIAFPGKISCTPAYSVTHAEELVKQNKYDFHILDFHLPDGNSKRFLNFCLRHGHSAPSLVISSERTEILETEVGHFKSVMGIHSKPLGIRDFQFLVNRHMMSNNFPKYVVKKDTTWIGELSTA